MPTVEPVPEPAQPNWTPDPEYADWSDEDVEAFYRRLRREHERRQVIQYATEASEQAMATYRSAKGIHDGMVWRQPTGYLDAVQPGETRVWEGQLYENTSEAPLLLSPGEAPESWTARPAPPVQDEEETPSEDDDPDQSPEAR